MRTNYKQLSIEEKRTRFLSKAQLDEESGCWNWTASRLSSGYGQATRIDDYSRWREGKPTQEGAHRVSYKMFVEDIPAGKVVRHLCNNKLCVNPEHLAVGTQKENMGDYKKVAKPRLRNSIGQFTTSNNTSLSPQTC